MTKKTPKTLSEWFWKLPAIAAGLGAIVAGSMWITDIARVVPQAEANAQNIILVEKTISKIEGILEGQQKINEYYMRREQAIEEQQEDEPVLSPDGRKFFDYKQNRWRSIKELPLWKDGK